jgi:hypothetical protein
MTTAYTVNEESVRAVTSVQNRRLRATWSAPPGAGVAVGHGAFRAKACAGMVTAASTRARTAFQEVEDAPRWAGGTTGQMPTRVKYLTDEILQRVSATLAAPPESAPSSLAP